MRLLVTIAFLLAFAVPVLAQTDPNVVKVDTSMRKPGTKPKIPDSTAAVKNAEKKAAEKKTTVVKDSARLAVERMPWDATRRSLMIPGWGQLYNIKARKGQKQFFRSLKIPIDYAGYITIGFIYNFNQQLYRKTLHEVQFRLENKGETRDPEYVKVEYAALVGAKDYYRRNRDLCILAFAGWHAIQAIDAYVDAQMFRYDIGDNLSVKLTPTFQPGATMYAAAVPVPSLKLSVRFK